MRPRSFAAIMILLAAAFSQPSLAAWQIVATEQGKRVEIDRDSIAIATGGQTTARGRIVLDKPIVDPRTSVSYRTIEVLNRFDCEARTHATLKRSYYKDDGELLRQEEVKSPFDMPVRSGTPDDKLLREVCRPKGAGSSAGTASQVLEKAGEAAAGLRKLNEELIEKEVKKDARRLLVRARGGFPGDYGMVVKKPKKSGFCTGNHYRMVL